MLSHVWLFATPWTVAHQAPLSMGFSRQEYQSGLLCSPPGNLPNLGIKLRSPAFQANSLTFELPREKTRYVSYSFLPKDMAAVVATTGLLYVFPSLSSPESRHQLDEHFLTLRCQTAMSYDRGEKPKLVISWSKRTSIGFLLIGLWKPLLVQIFIALVYH